MAYQGYIKLYRQIREKKWWKKQRERMTWGQAFIDLLLRTSHKDTEIPFDGGVLKIPKGSFITSQRKLAKDWHWSISTINAYLIWFKKHEKAIDFKTTKKYTHIYILNWSKYQEEEKKTQNKLKINSKYLDDDIQNADPNTPLSRKLERPEHLPEHPKRLDPNTGRTLAETINNVEECKRNNASKKELNKASKNNKLNKPKTMNQTISNLISYFKYLVKKQKGITPEINYAAAKERLKFLLERTEDPLSPQQIEGAFDWYLKSRKFDEFGASITTALSASTLNLFLQDQKKSEGDYE